jgi:hypothetical protein
VSSAPLLITHFSLSAYRDRYNHLVSHDFLDRLATQLKVGKSAACRRAIQQVLELVKKDYEAGGHSPTEAEREFRRLVENEEACK